MSHATQLGRIRQELKHPLDAIENGDRVVYAALRRKILEQGVEIAVRVE